MLQEALQKRDYTKAKELLKSGETLPDTLKDYHIKGIQDNIIRDKAFDIVDLFIENDFIETDIYEYDSFNTSIFNSIIKYLSNDEESIAFLNGFLSKVQNLNDELEGKSLLSLALENEVDIEIVKTMISNGCDVTIINRSEENLIHQVVKKYTRKFDKGLGYLQLLYDEGLDLDKPNTAHATPLHIAVKEHRNPYIQWLMENGADANAQNKNGESPFFLAISQGGGTEKYEIMRQYGFPDFDQTTQRGETLFCASDLNHLQLLLEDGADLYQTSVDTYGREYSKIDTLAISAPGFLQIAIDSGQLDVNRKDNTGNTILHKVCGRETLHEEKRAKEVYKLVKLLIASGADVNITNDKEETPMMIASQDNLKSKTVELLLSSS
ncbi:ankyrin repeat domain-containing protein [Costertonia aggregata]|uniref:Ankyrin repeat domain-containing protein n=1 Tax=Costertonia aggregata TaxID=343403 RepID=A0A7H9APE7_9FLAO|nr:ankyrin repeat domain-containing protein [Costertonia aggregata]QLG45341.1 ankyrin repeat domain-containing protein [Costertonia aggregata]